MFFFFKQKTAYDMRISDWSSDVCSSDLDDAERWLQLIEPADIPKFRGALEACLQGLSQKLNVVFRVRHYQGGTRIFNARATARAPEHGTIRRVVGDRKSTRLNSSH